MRPYRGAHALPHEHMRPRLARARARARARAHSTHRNKCVFIAAVAVAVAAPLLMPGQQLVLAALFSLPLSLSFLAQGDGPLTQMGPTDLHKAERALASRAGPTFLLNSRSRARSIHVYESRTRARTRVSFIKGAGSARAREDTEAPRMPCCANNTTAHVRDISFYYYPSASVLSLSVSPRIPPPSLPPSASSPSLLVLAALSPREIAGADAMNFACADSPSFILPPGTRLPVLDLRQCSLHLRNNIQRPYMIIFNM